MNWIERFARKTYVYERNIAPGYWSHPLLRHLGLPETWPGSWKNFEPKQQAFYLILENFCPPANLQGISRLLPAIKYTVRILLRKESSLEAQEVVEEFEQRTIDYIRRKAPNAEQRILTRRKLADIRFLGLWRFHFHCSQIDRAELNRDLQRRLASQKRFDARKTPYLKHGKLDMVYQAIGPALHVCLRRRLRDRFRIHDQPLEWEDELALIYGVSLDCEHTVQIAHLVLPPSYEDAGPNELVKKVDEFLRTAHKLINFPEQQRAKHLENIPSLLHPFIHPVANVSRLLKSYGALHQKKKRSFHGRRPRQPFKRVRGRLVSQGEYVEEATEAVEASVGTTLHPPFRPILGIPDDKETEATFVRQYGIAPQIAHDAGETEDDYAGPSRFEIPATWLSDPYLTAIKHKVQMESAILDPAPPIWSARCLMVSTIKNYLSAAKRRPAPVRLISMLALFSGLSPRDIASIQFDIPECLQEGLSQGIEHLDSNTYQQLISLRDHSPLYLDAEKCLLVYALDSDRVAYFDEQVPEFADACLPGSFLVAIRLPPIVRNALIECDVDELKSHFGEWADMLAEAGRISSENVTPARLRATFRSLFVGQMGMPELFANLISHNIPIQNRAQHFYANIDLAVLNRCYMEAAVAIQKLLDHHEDVANLSEQPPASSKFRTGSRLVPVHDRLRQYFFELHASFSPYLDAGVWDAETWNRLNLFVFRLLQLSLGTRPMRDRLPTWDDVSLKLGWLRVSDKDNLHYFESRLIPLPSLLLAWMKFIKQNQPRAFWHLNLPLALDIGVISTSPCRHAFVFADTESNQLRPFHVDDLSKIESGIPFSVPWRWRANALRHHLLTRLLNAGTNQSIIDFIMGHKHSGGEPFGRFSLAHMPTIANQAKEAVDQHVISPLKIPEPPVQ